MNVIETRFNELLGRKMQKSGERPSLYQISQDTGIGYATVTRWAKGEVTRFDADVLERLCIYFECQVGDLVRFSPDPVGE